MPPQPAGHGKVDPTARGDVGDQWCRQMKCRRSSDLRRRKAFSMSKQADGKTDRAEYRVDDAYPPAKPAFSEYDHIEAHGWREEYTYLRICATCFHLFETNRPDGLNQRCRCAPDRGPRWPGSDFNERASLCRCCGFEVMRSGSRWSEFFCRECGLFAMGLSVSARQIVFPIGRHSLMHTWMPGNSTRIPASQRDQRGGSPRAFAREFTASQTERSARRVVREVDAAEFRTTSHAR
jgi:hypothetical protein